MLKAKALVGLLLLSALLLWASLAPEQARYVGMRLDSGQLIPAPPGSDLAEPATGLQKAFPDIVQPDDNPTTPEKVELGRLLFFDPILSDDNTMSCAHCHHPELGFSDGLPRSRGRGAHGVGIQRRGGIELTRGAPTLWNALYNHRQFWDGRAADLEEQARMVITTPEEVNANPDELVRELKAIPEYRRLFDRAFGGENGSSITFGNIAKAIAAFERTLVSFNSRFDRYAAGDGSALTPQEKRGLKLFLSPKTRCNECHGLPTFANRDFKVIGVPNPTDGPPDVQKAGAEPGRGGGPNGAFKIPTLRNIALTAPYMHNGVFRTLEEVLDFYANGGGRGMGLNVPLQDDKIRKFTLTPQEKADLIAFLLALTDESAKPAIPERVPSGLPVVSRMKPHPPTRLKIGGTSNPSNWSDPSDRSGSPSPTTKPARRIVEVRPGESIQEAVDRAGRNGIVRIYPGVYHENVLVIHHGVTIEGVTQNGKRPVLDGKNRLPDAIAALGNHFTVQNLEIRNYQGNGVVVHKARNVAFRHLRVHNTGLYGVYPIECDGVLVEKCVVSGVRDAGIYVGQSRNIIVRQNEAFQNVTGIEIENSVNALVEENYVHQNTGGILVFLLPFNPSKVQDTTIVRRNRVHHNNTPNFADPNAIVANVLKGTGIMILAADRTEVYENEVIGNGTVGIAVVSLLNLFPRDTRFDVEPFP
ncbi:MAG: right-handed parallel beta-helix repeat-containing protein, partial [Fimbriimonadales bacterium]|nr:right-handed parallel beta-helix repeat-containing protein [Fimbriimonadales bacterium]